MIGRGQSGQPYLPRLLPARPARLRYDRGPLSRRTWLTLLALLLLLGLGSFLLVTCDDHQDNAAPTSLAQAHLGGARRLPGRVCMTLVSDVSSSMAKPPLPSVRASAVRDLLEFSRRELAPDDVLGGISFAGDAQTSLPLTPIRDIQGTPRLDPLLTSGGTAFLPVLKRAESMYAGQRCAASALAVVSDGELAGDSPQALGDEVAAAAFTRVVFFIPGKNQPRPTALSDPRLGGIQVVNFRPNGDDLGLAYGRLLADLTGRQLAGR
ncbi:vWA domain-containing protein [Frankia sp. AgKG'84/4]|uniref:hypothetical protein n=1 Tax=Frankia sp. AgKG'84/4 TaxID=573490 RepID=UPI00200C53EA|nr:hypothetical protein [Frankia sp. AgKG'84/4]MCL9795598.1 hypothetical protein [Frankia sp. AgKG'84/4]